MTPRLCCDPHYANDESRGQRNPSVKLANSGFRNKCFCPRIRNAEKLKTNPKQSPVPLDCSNMTVSEHKDPVAKAHAGLRDSKNRTALYSARQASKVLYQLCSTRNLYATPAAVASAPANSAKPREQTR